MAEKVHVKIKRQQDPGSAPYWEEFQVPYEQKMNTVSILMQIQRNPVNLGGQKTAPVSWECSCLEEVCGACTMVINGRARQACSTLLEQLQQPITLEPLSKFPVICDLIVDRQQLFENLKKVHAWVDVDGSYDLGPGPRIPEKIRQYSYLLSRCMSCGICLEVCPQYRKGSAFLGAGTFGQLKLFNNHPLGGMNKEARFDTLMGPGGIAECGNAQNCVKTCPKQLPLSRVIGELNKEVTFYGIKRWLTG